MNQPRGSVLHGKILVSFVSSIFESGLMDIFNTEYAFRLPVPEKTQKQHNYILFPRSSSITPNKPTSPIPDPLVFTIPDTAPKPGTITGKDAAAVSDDYKTLFDWAIAARLKAVGNDLKIVQADEKLFASEIRQPHRPGEKAVFVKGFRGSKDGYLFFLPNGILWGFKKPLLFLPHERISAVSYVNVLQRTFNMNVEVDTSAEGEESGEEYEFAMLDQEDFAGIDAYAQRHGLMNQSMAEQRKAKRLNVNVVKDEEGNVVGNAESGELERVRIFHFLHFVYHWFWDSKVLKPALNSTDSDYRLLQRQNKRQLTKRTRKKKIMILEARERAKGQAVAMKRVMPKEEVARPRKETRTTRTPKMSYDRRRQPSNVQIQRFEYEMIESHP